MKPAISFLKFFTWLVVLAFLVVSKKGVSQNNTTSKNLDTIPFIRYGQVSTKFSKPTEELKKGQIISNVLKVINHADIPLNFSVDVSCDLINLIQSFLTLLKQRLAWCMKIIFFDLKDGFDHH